MVRSRIDGTRFHVISCAWTTTDAARVLAELRHDSSLLSDCTLHFVTRAEMESISRQEATQAQARAHLPVVLLSLILKQWRPLSAVP